MGNTQLIPHIDSDYTTQLAWVDNWAYFIFISLLQSILGCGHTNRCHHFCSQEWSTIDIYESIKLYKIICKSSMSLATIDFFREEKVLAYYL